MTSKDVLCYETVFIIVCIDKCFGQAQFHDNAKWRKHQRTASLALCEEIHQGPLYSLHNRLVMRKAFPCYNAINILCSKEKIETHKIKVRWTNPCNHIPTETTERWLWQTLFSTNARQIFFAIQSFIYFSFHNGSLWWRFLWGHLWFSGVFDLVRQNGTCKMETNFLTAFSEFQSYSPVNKN